MSKFEVEFYQKPNGKQPVREFLLDLDPKMRAKAASIISILQDNGYELRETYSKHVSDGIFELRIKQGSSIIRLLYFFYYKNRIVLTNGFVKKADKLTPQELRRAFDYRRDYLAGKEKRSEQ